MRPLKFIKRRLARFHWYRRLTSSLFGYKWIDHQTSSSMRPSIWWEKHLLLPINLINLIQKYRFNIPPKTDMGCVCPGSNQRNLISIKAKKIGENFGNASATLITQRDTSCISIEEGVKTEIDVTHLASSVDGADHDEFLIKYKRT